MTSDCDPSHTWRFFVDRGGTFTDIVAQAPGGQIRTLKLLSRNPGHYEDAALAGIERILADAGASGETIGSVRIGTTIGTNALLERTGAATVLVTTDGFADVLRIGTQQRPDIFALDIRLPRMLYTHVIEARERIAADGAVLQALDAADLRRQLIAAREGGAESVAIALVNAYRNPAHEEAAAHIAASAGFEYVSVSTQINPTIRLVDRGDTAVADAYLTPVLDSYKAQLQRGLAQRLANDRLLFMQSHGGLIEAEGFRGADSVLSGPAGGVVGMAASAREAGFDEVIGFDMGGTSTDVSVFAGHYERAGTSLIAGCRIARPMLHINTVAAGGGSLLQYRGQRLQVGPESAGAWPGPACYRNGGPLTLTDANVLLGRIQPDHFPEVFGPAANEPLDTDAVMRAFDKLAADIAADGGPQMETEALAEGFLQIAIANMAQAIEQVSVQRGHDVTRFALACFGGAGGQHACGVADALGIETILVDPLSGVLSAWGLGVAERRSIRAAGIHAPLSGQALADARQQARALTASLGDEIGPIAAIEQRANLRIAGSDTLLDIAFGDGTDCAELEREFANRHRQRYGFAPPDVELILQSIEVEAIAAGSMPERKTVAGNNHTAARAKTRPVRFAGHRVDTRIHERSALAPDDAIDGPAVIVEDNATIIIEPGWRAVVNASGTLIVRRVVAAVTRQSAATQADPVMLEIFNNQFMHVAEQMGLVLEQTAHSVNIKERLDYSCALFDRDGELIANAPHVPVHLGSMGDSVQEVIRTAVTFEPGEAWMLNAPYRGGTHLPDITIVTPVFEPKRSEPGFFVASRAHHADIGGIAPGSMPANSHTIDEEGIEIDPVRIVANDRLLEGQITTLLAREPWPARNPAQNLADFKAQLAANAKGQAELMRLLERYGSDVVHAYMRHVRANAAACAAHALQSLQDGTFTVDTDDGGRIAIDVAIDRQSGRARIDFSGTSGMSPGNLNAPQSVVRAVVLYVLRTQIAENIPLNAGCLEPVDIVIPPACLLDPVHPAAVAGGNVETSQCVADALLAALGAAAASQGTMNNLTFGDETHQYYETICGGCGAGPDFDGASAVHSHMTNSRLTDVEVLEQRFPVRVRQFGVRHGSGGDGRQRGGDGVIRDLEFLAPMQLSLLAGRRRTAPFGLAGGEPGQPGRDTIVRSDGSREALPPAAEVSMNPGDRIVIETPGGGGYGAK